jgi:hypothetical protein
MTKLRLTVVVLTLSAISVSAQGPTLRELARRGDGVVGGISSGWAGAPFRSIASRSDLVIEGTLVKHRSYLTPDERQIFTDYEFSVTQVIFQRKPQSSDQPGPPAPLIFKTEGGTVVFDGVPMMYAEESNGRKVTLMDGNHVVIFGHYDSADGKWLFSPWEVFYTSGGMVQNDLPVFEGLDEGLAPFMPISAFAAKVREVANQR